MPRIWATLGNAFRISALIGFLVAAYVAYQAIQRFQVADFDDIVRTQTIYAVVLVVASAILWALKPVLITGQPMIIGPIVRVLTVVYMLLWLIGTLGLGLIFLAIVYVFTGEPAAWEYAGSAPRQKGPSYKAPVDWQPNAQIGPSGAMLYSDSSRSIFLGHMDSYQPVQILEEHAGFSRVVAQTGQAGWVDERTVARTA